MCTFAALCAASAVAPGCSSTSDFERDIAQIHFDMLEALVAHRLEESRRVVHDLQSDAHSSEMGASDQDVFLVDFRLHGRGQGPITFFGDPIPDSLESAMVEVEFAVNPRIANAHDPIAMTIDCVAPGADTVVAARWGTLDDASTRFVTLDDAQLVSEQEQRYQLALATHQPAPDASGDPLHMVLRVSLDARFEHPRIATTNTSR